MKIRPGIVAIGVAAVFLSGCMGPPGGFPSGHPTGGGGAHGPGSTPTPTATQARETGLVPPARVFGGDCNALYSAATVSAALGATVTLQNNYANDPGFAVERVGGISCYWSGADPTTSLGVAVVAMPAEAVTYTTPTGCSLALYDTSGCTLEDVHNGIRLSGAIFDAYGGATATAGMQAALTAAFETSATEAMSAPVPIPAAGSWAGIPDCSGVVAAGDYSAVPGLGAGATGEPWGGFDGFFPPAMSTLWSQYSPTACGLIGPSAEIGFAAEGGLRWQGAASASAAGASALAVSGIDEVWVKEDGGRYYVNVLDGPNWLSFDVAHVSNVPAIAQQLVTALDTTAIP